jgi:hypothetical protein
MTLIGLGVVWFGYSLAYYGYSQVTGGNWGFWDLTIPGKYDPSVKKDGQ